MTERDTLSEVYAKVEARLLEAIALAPASSEPEKDSLAQHFFDHGEYMLCACELRDRFRYTDLEMSEELRKVLTEAFRVMGKNFDDEP